jgi:hypothetical protein
MLGASVGPMSLGAVAAISVRLPLVPGAVALALCLLILLRPVPQSLRPITAAHGQLPRTPRAVPRAPRPKPRPRGPEISPGPLRSAASG